MEHKQIIKGDYVFTPIQNAFNGKTSYWVSKRDYTIAVYAFTPWSEANLREMLQDKVLDSYITLFNEQLARLTASDKPQPKVLKHDDDTRMAGIIYEHGDSSLSYWHGFSLSEAEEDTIYEVLKEHDTEGSAICSDRKDIAMEICPELKHDQRC